MATRLLLQANCEKLLEQYQANMIAVKELQFTLIEDVLPSLETELALDSEQIAWAKQWLEDTQTMFQLLRRENFTRSFAMESIRKNLSWRLKNLWPPEPEVPLSRVHFLPSDVRDPFRRPIIVIRAVGFKVSSGTYIPLLIRAMEEFRLRLKALNDPADQRSPALQYIVVFDVKDLSVQNLSVDLISWILRDLVPRFPGMLAAVFIVNSSWAHSGMWNIAKRVLPAPAVSRIFFSSQKELAAYFTPSSLPKDYGGSLPHLYTLASTSAAAGSSSSSSDFRAPIVSAISPTYLSPTSLLNPFFGYPALSSHGYPSLHHGRRRKRDLLGTLAILFWLRWRRPITTCLWLVTLMFVGRMWFRKWLFHSAGLLKSWRESFS
ncbi:CRAL-TRIO domain-containing protein [Lentinula aciculospora]|uniref:CRAL-TRIO domain-containing protein n=1 Tax=Lentinula aciculospora TaxID=153920 RepID=A0A9W9AUG6_9AGAR|nr:CRAL-TRIO domain-containing protein [Lentinula aciculospora]KAJ4490858.1 CRAL-TRIO domain-containing protein [Lentinula aciculospora]